MRGYLVTKRSILARENVGMGKHPAPFEHNEQKQHQAYRILRELLEPSDPK